MEHIPRRLNGAVAQLGEHDTGSVGVRGSSPLSSTKRSFSISREGSFVFEFGYL
jgi:hypothetical protein